MTRPIGLVLATTTGALAAFPAVAAAGREVRVADVTFAYEAKLTSERELVHTPDPDCGGSKGTVYTLATSVIKTVVKTKLVRAPIGSRRVDYVLQPWRPIDADGGSPVSLRYQRTRTQSLDTYARSEDEGPCVERPAPDNGSTTRNCRFTVNLVFQWNDGRVFVPFETKATECGTSHPGSTALLRPRRRYSAQRMYRNRRNVITAKAEKRTEVGEGNGEAGTQLDRWTWKATFVRTSAWRPLRR